MRKSFIFLLLGGILSTSFLIHQVKAPLSVKVVIVGKGEIENKAAKRNGYFALISVSNTTDTTYSFVLMNCSWQRDNFTLSNKNFSIVPTACDANFARPISLSRGETIEFKCMVAADFNNKFSDKTRVGFMTFKSIWDIDRFLTNRDRKIVSQVFWSDEIEIRDYLNEYNIK